MRITRWVSLIERCGAEFRKAEFEDLGLCSCNHMYIFYLCHHPGTNQDELSKMLHLNKSNVTRSLQKLESDGFVTREIDSSDKRMIRVYPTKKATEVLPKIIEKLNCWNEMILEDLSEEEKVLLNNLLEKISRRACQKTNQMYHNE